MTSRLTAETFCFALAQTLGFNWDWRLPTRRCKVLAARWSSHVGRRLHHRAEVPTGVAHEARSALSPLASVGSSMAAGAAFAHPPVREPQGRPIFFNCHEFEYDCYPYRTVQ